MSKPSQLNQHTAPNVIVVKSVGPKFYRPRDACRRCGCSVGHLRNQARKGKFQVFKLDGLVLIDVASFELWLNSAKPATGTPWASRRQGT